MMNMNIPLEELDKYQPITEVWINERIDFAKNRIYKTNSGDFLIRKDGHYLRKEGMKGLLYRINNRLILRFPSDENTEIEKIDVIESETVDRFDGFYPGKKYKLKNDQVWQQTDKTNSLCSGTGRVLIYNNIIKVDNWDFYPQVKKIRGPTNFITNVIYENYTPLKALVYPTYLLTKR